ncbi:MAG TPA: hypothetical protein VKB31_05175 [Trueperaceae bacterium]|nr:hypothetical protein [Trueperaceae bacterium]
MKLRIAMLAIGAAALAVVLAACSTSTTGGATGTGACTALPSAIDSAMTLPAGCYTAASDVEVNAALTVDPGAVITMDQGVAIDVGNNSGNVGSLHADGTAGTPIVFKGNGTPGYWADINFYSADGRNLLNHVTVKDAGSLGDGNVYVGANAAVTISNSIIQNSGGYGVYLTDASAQLPGFSANVLTGNAAGAMYILANQMGMLDTASVYTGNTLDRVEVDGGTITGAATWPAIDVPFFASSDISVRAAVSAGGGMTMRMAQGVALNVGDNAGNTGSLHAVGTTAQPVRFLGNGTQGYWGDINFYSADSANQLTDAVVEGGGSIGDADIYIASNSQVTVTDSTISDSGGYGICRYDTSSTLTQSGNTFTNDVKGSVSDPSTNPYCN